MQYQMLCGNSFLSSRHFARFLLLFLNYFLKKSSCGLIVYLQALWFIINQISFKQSDLKIGILRWNERERKFLNKKIFKILYNFQYNKLLFQLAIIFKLVYAIFLVYLLCWVIWLILTIWEIYLQLIPHSWASDFRAFFWCRHKQLISALKLFVRIKRQHFEALHWSVLYFFFQLRLSP